MSSKLRRTDLIIKLAQRKEDHAATLLGQWRSRVQTQRDQLQNLIQYEANYLALARGQSQTVIQLQTQRAFLFQLSDVLTEQRERLQQMDHQFGLYQQQWRYLHKRRTMLEEHRGRQAAAELKTLDKQWDRLCDELTSRTFFNQL